MLKALSEFLINNVALSIFICLALGYFIGKVRVKSFSLGSTVGTAFFCSLFTGDCPNTV